MTDNLDRTIVAALVEPVIGHDANGYRLHLTSEQAFALVPSVRALLDRMKGIAYEGGWEAADSFHRVSHLDFDDSEPVFRARGGQIEAYPSVCASGVGGGEVCMRRKGHDGDHDPDSTEVRL